MQVEMNNDIPHEALIFDADTNEKIKRKELKPKLEKQGNIMDL